MFKITIEGDTLNDLASNVLTMAAQFQTTVPEGKSASKSKAKAPAQPEPEVDDELTGDDALDAPAEPMPEGADAIVDAGTGKPAGKPAKAKADAPIQMTMDDVKVAAAKLAAKDTPALAKILKKYDASKLSEVPKEKLGDFAADVMEALG